MPLRKRQPVTPPRSARQPRDSLTIAGTPRAAASRRPSVGSYHRLGKHEAARIRQITPHLVAGNPAGDGYAGNGFHLRPQRAVPTKNTACQAVVRGWQLIRRLFLSSRPTQTTAWLVAGSMAGSAGSASTRSAGMQSRVAWKIWRKHDSERRDRAIYSVTAAGNRPRYRWTNPRTTRNSLWHNGACRIAARRRRPTRPAFRMAALPHSRERAVGASCEESCRVQMTWTPCPAQYGSGWSSGPWCSRADARWYCRAAMRRGSPAFVLRPSGSRFPAVPRPGGGRHSAVPSGPGNRPSAEHRAAPDKPARPHQKDDADAGIGRLTASSIATLLAPPWT